MKLSHVKKIFSFVSLFLFLVLILAPVVSHGQTTAGTSGIVTVCKGSDGSDVPCDSFAQLVGAVMTVVKFAVSFALFFSVVILARAGWIYMNSGGSPGELKKAHAMFGKVIWGIAWVLGAWLVVNLIVTTLVNPSMVTTIIKN